MAAICKCKIENLPFNYLGVPLGANPKRLATWEPIIDRVRKKLSGWKCRSLSWAGKVVLINVVLSSLPICFMSLFHAPVTVIKRIDKIRRNFLWGNTDGKRKMARIRWNIVCKPKVKGRVGVANLEVKNKALLAKWSWRFANEKEALWRKVILAKYGSNIQSWRFKTTNKKDMSVLWRGIVENAKDEKVSKWVGPEAFFWKIGNRKSTLFWWDIWCGDRPLKSVFPRLFRLAKNKILTLIAVKFGILRSVHNELMIHEKFWWFAPQRCQVVSQKLNSTVSFWRLPPYGWLKFNVCGIAKEDKTGCGGILRDLEGVARGIFSGAAGTNVAEEAKIEAVKITLEVFESTS
ncbi:hypothetical protein PVK06_013206 [Gossypium arboreum]|uniref:Uncharacterized protein n=1 Tax=Gossypium arboreum TaxID=29729 RepID=A0ABR0QEB4_GOSAR|nr:hypothetical protein PVK06_013206 [Gossypium arboreum]